MTIAGMISMSSLVLLKASCENCRIRLSSLKFYKSYEILQVGACLSPLDTKANECIQSSTNSG